jgi:ankyrin repeat protein
MNRHFDETGLWAAVLAESLDGVKTYLNRGTDPNAVNGPGNTPLFTAAARGNVAIAEELLKHGAEVNYSNPSGETPLYVAVEFVQLPMVIALMKAGANPEIVDHERNFPLSIAKHEVSITTDAYRLRGRDFPAILAELKKWPHVDPDITDPNTGITNLMIAAVNYTNDLDFLRMIYYSDNLNKQDQDGNTALHYAVSQGGDAMKIHDLFTAGADTTIHNNRHETPFDLIEDGIEWDELEDDRYLRDLQTRLNHQ